MDLPKNEGTFSIDFTGEVTGKRYEGDFKCLCVLNITQKHQKELERTRLTADYKNPGDALAGLAEILSTLRIRIIDGPVWWQQSKGGSEIMDEGLLIALYDKVSEVEQSWRDQVKAKAQSLATPPSPIVNP